MMKFDAWYLPDGEVHLPEWMRKVNRRVDGRLSYQFHKYEAVLPKIVQRRVAIDVGAHVGLWSYFLARDFARVEAFEPMPEHVDCWRANMVLRHNASLHRIALGADEREVRLRTRTAGSSGDTAIEPEGASVSAHQVTLDSFGFDDVDLIKVDCEGYELFVLQGGEATILRNRPVIIVEQKPHTGGAKRYGISDVAAVDYLRSIGMKTIVPPISGDWFMGW
jgi:FkbM family methyltransferase